MNKVLPTLICFLIMGMQCYAQQKFTISGTIRSQKTGETIIGASIRAGNAGTTSNDYGFVSLTLEKGK